MERPTLTPSLDRAGAESGIWAQEHRPSIHLSEHSHWNEGYLFFIQDQARVYFIAPTIYVCQKEQQVPKFQIQDVTFRSKSLCIYNFYCIY